MHEELDPCNTAVKILQDVLGEMCKPVGGEDETGNTEHSDLTHSTP